MVAPTTWREVPALDEPAHALSVMFHDGARLASPREHLRFGILVLPVGDLCLPTGELVVCDPFNVRDARPFPVRVPSGRHPVVLSRAVSLGETTGGLLQDRVAGAMLRLSPEAPVRWAAVKVPTRGGVVTFGVDSGLACFTDRRTAEALHQRFPGGDEGSQEAPDGFHALLLRALPRATATTAVAGAGTSPETAALSPAQTLETWRGRPGRWGALRTGTAAEPPTETAPADVWLFESGRGDGRYVTYLGFTGSGALAGIAVDFGVLYEDAPGENPSGPKAPGRGPRRALRPA